MQGSIGSIRLDTVRRIRTVGVMRLTDGGDGHCGLGATRANPRDHRQTNRCCCRPPVPCAKGAREKQRKKSVKGQPRRRCRLAAFAIDEGITRKQ